MTVDPRASDDPAVLRAEIDRLRDLIGPNENSYRDLQAEVVSAGDAAREATLRAGAYRGRAVQLTAQVQRMNEMERRLRAALRPPARAARYVVRNVLGRRPPQPEQPILD